MDSSLIQAAIIIAGVVIFYAIMARGLLNASEPLRDRALQIYEKMMHSGRMTPEMADRLDDHLNEFYSSAAAWKLVALLLCAIVILPFRLWMRSTESQPTYLDDIPTQLHGDYDRFTNYWMLVVVANSPLATVLFAFFALIGLSYLAPLNMLSKMLASHEYGRRREAH